MQNLSIQRANSGRFISSWILLLSLLLLAGCGNRYQEQLTQLYNRDQQSLANLKDQLDNKMLSNALLIDKYAIKLMDIKPDYSDVASLLKKEATSKGNAFTALQKRLQQVNLEPKDEQSAAASLQELELINTAADPIEFNNALGDVVNTLASLSDGQLPVVNVPPSQVSTAQRANALIGNPGYGQWKQGSDGRSFWEWYGMYSLFSNVLGGRSYYNSWAGQPHYSYYGNYGRSRWGSNSDINRNVNLSKKYPSRYNKPSSATKSRYSTAARRSSSYGGSSSRSSGGSKSSGSRYSSYGSSSRSSSFSSSRGFRSGK
jgi:hypothetical protein